MRNQRRAVSWVVYRMALHGVPAGRPAVCEQDEWDALEAAKPGANTIIRSGILSEPEAERVARDAGYDAGKSKKW
jgi:hypothetical protein